MSVEIIDTLVPKNDGDFPVVEAKDVAVNEQRLPEVLNSKADKSNTYTKSEVDEKIASAEVDAYTKNESDYKFATKAELTNKADTSTVSGLQSEVENKADKSDVSELQSIVSTKADKTTTDDIQNQIDSFDHTPEVDEVVNARNSSDGTAHPNLKARLDIEHTSLKEGLSEISEILGIEGAIQKSTKPITQTEEPETVISELTFKAKKEYVVTAEISSPVSNTIYNFIFDSDGEELVRFNITPGETKKTIIYESASEKAGAVSKARTTKSELIGLSVTHTIEEKDRKSKIDNIETELNLIESKINNISKGIGEPKFDVDVDITKSGGSFASEIGEAITFSETPAWNRAEINVENMTGNAIKITFTKRNTNETAFVCFTDENGIVIAQFCKYGVTEETELKTEIVYVPEGAYTMYIKSFEGIAASKITAYAQDTESIYKKIDYIESVTDSIILPRMKYVCHQGVVTKAPLNTRKAYEIAGLQGAYALNMARGRISADGTIWIHHDAEISVDTNGTGIVEELTDAYLSTIKVTDKNSYSDYNIDDFTFDEIKLLTLEEGIQICLKYGMIPMIRMNSDGEEINEAVSELVDAYNLSENVIFSGTANFILAMHRKYPKAPCNYYNASYRADDFIQKFTQWNIPTNDVFSAMIVEPTPEEVKALHKAGYGVFSAFGYNSKNYNHAESVELIKHYAEIGCDFVNINEVIGAREL